jgi:hypothetical protein
MGSLVMSFGNVDCGRSPSITIKPISTTLDQHDNFALSELNLFTHARISRSICYLQRSFDYGEKRNTMVAVQSPKQSLEHPNLEKDTEIQKTADTESADSNTVEEEYPSSIQLLFISIAVIFSIFLAALDQVSVSRKS